MRFRRIIKNVTAIQWRGWPHEIKGLKQHPTYPQCATLDSHEEICKGDWIVTEGDNPPEVWSDHEFFQTFVRSPMKTRIDIIDRFEIKGRGTVFTCKLPEIKTREEMQGVDDLIGQQFDHQGDRWEIREVECFRTAFGVPMKNQSYGLLVKRIPAA
jgi:hypothetical protein